MFSKKSRKHLWNTKSTSILTWMCFLVCFTMIICGNKEKSLFITVVTIWKRSSGSPTSRTCAATYWTVNASRLSATVIMEEWTWWLTTRVCVSTSVVCREWNKEKKNPWKPIGFQGFLEGGGWDSNPRHSEPQSDALTNWTTSTM